MVIRFFPEFGLITGVYAYLKADCCAAVFLTLNVANKKIAKGPSFWCIGFVAAVIYCAGQLGNIIYDLTDMRSFKPARRLTAPNVDLITDSLYVVANIHPNN